MKMVMRGRLNIEMGVILVVGMVWLSMTIMPSSAQDNPLGLPICWAKINDCATNAGLDPLDPTTTYALCCPVIKPQVANTTCFCSIKDFIQNVPSDQPAVQSSAFEVVANKILADCKISSSFDQLCNGVTESESGVESSEAGKLSGIVKNGAAKIGRSVFGLVFGALIVWTMIMS